MTAREYIVECLKEFKIDHGKVHMIRIEYDHRYLITGIDKNDLNNAYSWITRLLKSSSTIVDADQEISIIKSSCEMSTNGICIKLYT